MFLTQIYGTLLGGFINYAAMTSIVSCNRAHLPMVTEIHPGAVRKFKQTPTQLHGPRHLILYKIGSMYEIVPLGLLVGAGVVATYRLFYRLSLAYY